MWNKEKYLEGMGETWGFSEGKCLYSDVHVRNFFYFLISNWVSLMTFWEGIMGILN